MRVLAFALLAVLLPAPASAGTDIAAACYQTCADSTHSTPVAYRNPACTFEDSLAFPRHVDRQQLFIMLRALSYERINDFECIEKQIIGAP